MSEVLFKIEQQDITKRDFPKIKTFTPTCSKPQTAAAPLSPTLPKTKPDGCSPSPAHSTSQNASASYPALALATKRRGAGVEPCTGAIVVCRANGAVVLSLALRDAMVVSVSCSGECG